MNSPNELHVVNVHEANTPFSKLLERAHAGEEIVLAQPVATATVTADLRAAFPDRGWRIRDPSEAAPAIRRFMNQTTLFLTLAGLTSLLVGGIGVANGVRAWLDARARSIATLRCLGASSGLVFSVCLIQVMALAGAGIGERNARVTRGLLKVG